MSGIFPTTALKDLTFVAFDTETTGLSPVAAKLVELSAVKFRLDGEATSTFSALINPETQIPPEVTAIHGITNEMVDDKPTAREVVPEFFKWVGSDHTVMVAHNAPFDLGFLEFNLARIGIPSPVHPVLDTLTLSRRLICDVPNYQLVTLREHLELQPGEHHRALADSHHVQNLLKKLLATAPEIETFGQLCDAGPPLYFRDPLEEVSRLLENLPKEFHTLKEAIVKGANISMIYDTGYANNLAKNKRVVTPQVMLASRGNLYLNAYCHTVRAERTFRMDKIVSFELVN